ncbi:MAG: hypothetical protein KIT20_05680 [Alphaproteobacteria bacterium]|nr:hypothetical protein [Alphaproteobacteria bacterium]
MTATSVHRYSTSALMPHYVRAITGTAIAGAVLLFTGFSSAMLWVAGPLCGLFLAFGAVTALRQATRIEVSSTGIRAIGPLSREILWEDLVRVDLRYYSTKRDRSDGWMQLKVGGGGGGPIRIESTIGDFGQVVRAVAREAAARGVRLSESSAANIEALAMAERKEAGPGRGNG